MEEKGMNNIKEILKDLIKGEEGIGVVEIILILVILIGLVLIFKDQMQTLVKRIFSSITRDTGRVLN